MYSAVMLIAMASSPDAATCGRRGGGYGCCGYAYSGCYGGSAYRSGGYYSSYGYPGYYGYPAYYSYYNYSPAPVIQSPVVASTPMPATAPATVDVYLPPDAKLSVDSKPVSATGSMRRLVSPPIEAGKDFTYHLSATVMRDGKEVKSEKQVTVRAGQVTPVSLDFPGDLANR